MDNGGTTDDDALADFRSLVEYVVDQATQRKGQMVHDHPSREHLISHFLPKSLTETYIEDEYIGKNMHGLKFFPQYLPCVRTTEDLRPMMISDMRLETNHRGRKVTVRLCTAPHRDKAVTAIVEDEKGTAVLLQLYNQPEEAVVPVKECLHLGKVLILKEPYFKRYLDGSYALRVDHVSDVAYLDGTEEEVPSKWRLEKATGDSQMIRKEGNKAVKSRSWVKAQRLYSSAIKEAKNPEEERLAYLNRSLINRRLGRVEEALSDAIAGNAILTSEKGFFREALALYAKSDWKRCLEVFQMLKESYPESVDAEKEITRVNMRIREQQTGEYSFRQLRQQAESTPPLIDCATFSATVEVRESPGRGLGLFTTKAVSAGDLLLCEKAFAYSYADIGSLAQLQSDDNATLAFGDTQALLKVIIEKTYHNPETCRAFWDLHRGDFGPVAISGVNEPPVVDSFLAESIVHFNCSGACRTTFAGMNAWHPDFFPSQATTQARNRSLGFATAGLWLLASRVNYSCVANCMRSFMGDIQIIRATADLEANTELLFMRNDPMSLKSDNEAQKDSSNWGCTSTCELCVIRKETTDTILERRTRLLKDIAEIYKDGPTVDALQVQLLIAQLENTYPVTEGRTLRVELQGPYFGLAAYYNKKNKLADAAKMIVQGLQETGFELIACPLVHEGNMPKFEIKRWGQVNYRLPWAFLILWNAYDHLSPELSMKARQYFLAAYSMLIGDSEAMSDIGTSAPVLA